MSYMLYDLPDGRKVEIVQYAVIGPMRDSLIDWVKDQVARGEESGTFVEGKWCVRESADTFGT